jgi:hypothetical protein
MALHDAAQVKPGAPLDIEFVDGKVGAVADGNAPRPMPPFRAPSPRRKGGPGDTNQGSLF